MFGGFQHGTLQQVAQEITKQAGELVNKVESNLQQSIQAEDVFLMGDEDMSHMSVEEIQKAITKLDSCLQATQAMVKDGMGFVGSKMPIVRRLGEQSKGKEQASQALTNLQECVDKCSSRLTEMRGVTVGRKRIMYRREAESKTENAENKVEAVTRALQKLSSGSEEAKVAAVETQLDAQAVLSETRIFVQSKQRELKGFQEAEVLQKLGSRLTKALVKLVQHQQALEHLEHIFVERRRLRLPVEERNAEPQAPKAPQPPPVPKAIVEEEPQAPHVTSKSGGMPRPPSSSAPGRGSIGSPEKKDSNSPWRSSFGSFDNKEIQPDSNGLGEEVVGARPPKRTDPQVPLPPPISKDLGDSPPPPPPPPPPPSTIDDSGPRVVAPPTVVPPPTVPPGADGNGPRVVPPRVVPPPGVAPPPPQGLLPMAPGLKPESLLGPVTGAFAKSKSIPQPPPAPYAIPQEKEKDESALETKSISAPPEQKEDTTESDDESAPETKPKSAPPERPPAVVSPLEKQPDNQPAVKFSLAPPPRPGLPKAAQPRSTLPSPAQQKPAVPTEEVEQEREVSRSIAAGVLVHLDEVQMVYRPEVDADKTDREVFFDNLPPGEPGDGGQLDQWLARFGQVEDVFRLSSIKQAGLRVGRLAKAGYVKFVEHKHALSCVISNVGSWSESERALREHRISFGTKGPLAKLLGSGKEELERIRSESGTTCLELRGEGLGDRSISKRVHFFAEGDDPSFEKLMSVLKDAFQTRLVTPVEPVASARRASTSSSAAVSSAAKAVKSPFDVSSSRGPRVAPTSVVVDKADNAATAAFFKGLNPELSPEENTLANAIVNFLERWKQKNPNKKPNLVHLGGDGEVREQKAIVLPKAVNIRTWIERRIGQEVMICRDAKGSVYVKHCDDELDDEVVMDEPPTKRQKS